MVVAATQRLNLWGLLYLLMVGWLRIRWLVPWGTGVTGVGAHARLGKP